MFMIDITLKENGNIFTVEIIGHSKSSDEPCARVTTAFDLLFIILGKSRIEHKKEKGYSFLSCYINKETKETLKMFSQYFQKLSELYSQIKVNEVKNNG